MSHVTTVLQANAALAECPRWDEQTQRLYWVDIDRFELHCFDPETGLDEKRVFAEEIGCFSLCRQGGFVLAMRSGFYYLPRWSAEPQFLCDPEADMPLQRFNDGRCDPVGRFIAGSLNPKKDAYTGRFFSLNAQGEAKYLVGNNWTSNGLAFSPAGDKLYYSDTPAHTIYVCDYDPASGEVGEPQVFCEFPHGHGRPDGAAVDSEGYYWTALYAGSRIARISPAGEVVTSIGIPAKNVTMVAFGGADLKTLYVTSARGVCNDAELAQYPHSGGLFAVDVDVPGLPEARFDYSAAAQR